MIQFYGNSNIQFRGMVPLKDYKGPILKLTQAEIKNINVLQENINMMEIELYNLDKKYAGKHLTTEIFQFYAGKWDSLNTEIKSLKEMIRNIKINRLKEQNKL